MCVARAMVSEYSFRRVRSRSNRAHQAEVHQHQFHRRVADALAEGHSGGVHLVRSRGYCRQRVRHGEAAIVVPVPIDAQLFAARLYDFVDRKFDQVVGPARRRVSYRVAKNK